MNKKLFCMLLAGLSMAQLHAENEIATGDYYIRNNATGMFLKAGHDWGVMAAMGKHGKRFTYEVVNGQYKLNTNLSGDNTSEHWFRGDCWIDNGGTPLQISWVDEAKHLARIKNIENNQELCQNYPWETARGRFSDNYNDADGNNRDYVFLWQVLTRQDLLAELTQASAYNGYPKDATFMIECWDFGRHDDGPAALWQGLCEDGETPRGVLDWGGNWSNYVGQKKGVSNYDIHQQLTGLPNGVYQLRVQGFYRAGGSEGVAAQLYAGSAQTALKNITDGSNPANCEAAGNAFNNNEYNNAVTVEVTDGTLRIGIKAEGADANAWCVFDNFELYYYGAATSVAAVEADTPVVPDGTYLLRNVATGKYVSQGHDWGTQLATSLYNGMNVKTTYQGKGYYTLDSQVFENAGSHFIGTNGYVDGGAYNYTIRKNDEGKYTIQIDNLEAKVLGDNGDGRSGLHFMGRLSTPEIGQWELVTPTQILTEMASASAANPVNATPLVKGSYFGRHDKMVEAWQGNFAVLNQNDNMPNYIGQSSDDAVEVYQTLSDLPNGQYIVSAQAFVKNAAGVLYANSAETLLPAGEAADTRAAAEAFNDGQYGVSLKVWVSDGKLRLGIRSQKEADNPWCVFDNFTLTYLGTDMQLQDGVAFGTVAADMALTSVSYDRQVTAGKMVTFILPVAVPADKLNGTAYRIAAQDGTTLKFVAVEGSTQANVPYILVPAQDGKLIEDLGSCTLAATPAELGTTVGSVNFIGTYSTQAVNNVYGLSDGKFVGARTGVLKPYRAAISVSSETKEFNVVLDEVATAIAGMTADGGVTAEGVYNLAGQRVKEMNKGIYIINGKKYLK